MCHVPTLVVLNAWMITPSAATTTMVHGDAALQLLPSVCLIILTDVAASLRWMWQCQWSQSWPVMMNPQSNNSRQPSRAPTRMEMEPPMCHVPTLVVLNARMITPSAATTTMVHGDAALQLLPSVCLTIPMDVAASSRWMLQCQWSQSWPVMMNLQSNNSKQPSRAPTQMEMEPPMCHVPT